MRAAPKIPEYEQIAKQVAFHAEVVVRRRLPPAAARAELAALDRDVDRILEKRRWMLAQPHAAPPPASSPPAAQPPTAAPPAAGERR